MELLVWLVGWALVWQTVAITLYILWLQPLPVLVYGLMIFVSNRVIFAGWTDLGAIQPIPPEEQHLGLG